MRKTALTTIVLASLLALVQAEAKVPPEEAAKLGKELTPLGAIRAGNKEGTIPAWEGGLAKPPPGWQAGQRPIDPYPDDKVLFTITGQNVDQYKDKLSPGQVAMLRRYPTWHLNVYPTRRSAAYPQRVYDGAIANATKAELAEGGNGVINGTVTSPFPIPKSGVECIWNHVMRYRSTGADRPFVQAAPTAGGDYTLVKMYNKVLFPYAEPGATTDSINNILAYFLEGVDAPPRLAGELLLVYETLDQVKQPREAWTYNPGQRRVRRAPNVAYDNPGTASDGQRTADQLDSFNGAPDRYEWTLVGREEKYIPYNANKVFSDKISYDEIIKPGHLNPELLRYELHRVWVVEAKLRPGTSHIYARRTFYFDEDTWQAEVVDQYDGRGELWRVSEAYGMQFYQVPEFWEAAETVYDLQNGRYLVLGLNNHEPQIEFDAKLSRDEFTPDALRRLGVR